MTFHVKGVKIQSGKLQEDFVKVQHVYIGKTEHKIPNDKFSECTSN